MSLFPELEQKSSSSLFPELEQKSSISKTDQFDAPKIPPLGIPGFDIASQMPVQTGVSIAKPMLEQGGFLAGESLGTAMAPGPGTIAGAAAGQGAGSVASDLLGRYAQNQPMPTPEEMKIQFATGAGIGGASAAAGFGIGKALKGGAKLKEALSGVQAARFPQLANKPQQLLPEFMGGPKSIKEAGKLLGEAEVNAGIQPPTVGELINFKRTGLNKEAVEELDTLEKTVNAGIPLDNFKTQSILDNISRLDRVIKSESSQEFSELSAKAANLRKVLVNALAQNEPQLQAARQAYHESAVRRSFTEPFFGLLPETKGGAISKVARYSIPWMLGLGLGGRGKEGAGLGAGMFAGESPLVLGGLTALGAAGGGALGLPLSMGLSALAKKKQ